MLAPGCDVVWIRPPPGCAQVAGGYGRCATDQRMPGKSDGRPIDHRDHGKDPRNETDERIPLRNAGKEQAEKKRSEQPSVSKRGNLEAELHDRIFGVGEE